MKKGDIVLIPFPFTDLSGIKNRPALILIDSDEDITVSFITTQLKWLEKFDVRLESSNENGLKKASLIRLSKITTIDKELVIGKLGQLTDSEIEEVNRGLIGLLDLK
jgi:mRNA interferase MazF